MNRLQLLILAIFLTTAAWAQAPQPTDTLTLTLAEAEQLLAQKALPLLVQRYNIDMADAQVVQARLLPNPSVNLEYNLYNPGARKVAETNANTQSGFAVQQLIEVAGKRSKRVEVALRNRSLTQAEYFDLVRNLTFQLREAFVNNYFLTQAHGIYRDEVPTLQVLVDNMTRQADKGNVPLMDVARLRALLIDLQQQQYDINVQQTEVRSTLRLLLGIPANVVVRSQALPAAKQTVAQSNVQQLIQLALQNRPDVNRAQQLLAYSEANVRLQKSLAVPDVSLGYMFDRRGSAWNNYSGVTLGMDLPVFNRNQGNIKLAEAQRAQSRQQTELTSVVIENEVAQAYQNALLAEQLLTQTQESAATFDQLQNAAVTNYRRGNISLLQFIDMFQAYTQTRMNLLELQRNRSHSLQKLNLVTGTNQF